MIPINILLIVFLLFMLIILVFTFFNVYHLVSYGRSGGATVLILFLYLIIILTMLAISLMFISQVDWSATIQVLPKNPVNIFQ